MPRRESAFISLARPLLRYRVARSLGLVGRGLRRLALGGFRDATPIPPAAPPPPHAEGHAATVRALVIDAHPPRPDLDSGSVRMVAVLRILVDLGLQPAFIADDFRTTAVPPGVCTPRLGSIRDAAGWIATRPSIEVVVLSRESVATPWLHLVRALLPTARVVFDTVDLHFVRERREADARRSTLLRLLSQATRRRELGLVDACNATWVVSEDERQRLLDLNPNANVSVVSNIIDAEAAPVPFEQRQGFVFLGNYRHAPNVDAVEWLASAIWPAILARRPTSTLRIVGPALPTSVMRRLSSLAGVTIDGHVPRVEPVLQRARVMLAPLRYGAGVKGKINDAFACGLPVVATACAVEGMHAGEPIALIADDAPTFADAAVALHDDRAQWEGLQAAGMRCLDARFSTAIAREAVRTSLVSLGISLEQP